MFKSDTINTKIHLQSHFSSDFFLTTQYAVSVAATAKQALQLVQRGVEMSPVFQQFGRSGSYIKGLLKAIKLALFSLINSSIINGFLIPP